MYTFAAFLVLLGFTAAQRPTPCESPNVWTGRLFQVDRDKGFAILGKISYDAVNKRVRVVDEVDIKGKKSYYDYIVLYEEKMLYRIELSTNRTGECTRYDFNEPFKPAQVPQDAKFGVEAYIGASLPGAGVLVNTFYGEMKEREETVYYVTTVTQEGCIPVSSVAYGKDFGGVHSSFFDIMSGVNPEHFVPPSDCRPGKELKKFPRF